MKRIIIYLGIILGVLLLNFLLKELNLLPKIPREYIIPISILSLLIGSIIGRTIKKRSL